MGQPRPSERATSTLGPPSLSVDAQDLASLALLAFISTFGLSVVSPTLPLYIARFGVSYAAIGGFFSAYSLTWALLQIYTGHLSDRYGRKGFILAGLLCYGLSALGCALAQSFACAHAHPGGGDRRVGSAGTFPGLLTAASGLGRGSGHYAPVLLREPVGHG